MLTDWAYSMIGTALVAKERQLRLGVAAQLAESLWLHEQRVGRRARADTAAVRPQHYLSVDLPVHSACNCTVLVCSCCRTLMTTNPTLLPSASCSGWSGSLFTSPLSLQFPQLTEGAMG